MSAFVVTPARRAGATQAGRRRFAERTLRRDSLSDVRTTSAHLRAAIRYWRRPASSAGSCCSACNAKLQPLQGEREWGRPFCNEFCVASYARRTGRLVYVDAD